VGNESVEDLFKQSFVLLLASLMTLSVSILAAERHGKQKVVYHINFDNPALQQAAMRNIQNHINAVGSENLEIRVVLHGHGLSLLLYPKAVVKLARF
jgi:hypothetical protein